MRGESSQLVTVNFRIFTQKMNVSIHFMKLFRVFLLLFSIWGKQMSIEKSIWPEKIIYIQSRT